MISCKWHFIISWTLYHLSHICVLCSPDALSPQTLQATNDFVPVDELDEFESAADVVVFVAVDDVGENGWFSANKQKDYN